MNIARFNRCTVISTILLGFTLIGVCHAQLPEIASAESLADSEVLFFEDFADSELDRTNWNVLIMGQPYNDEQQAYIDSPETLYILPGNQVEGAQNGALVLHPRFKAGYETPEGRKVDFVSSRINTKGKVEVTYGTLSARIKLPEGSGVWPAFWALGTGPWPATGEIDVMECIGEPEWISFALHGPGYSGDTPLVEKHMFENDFDANEWHVYSVDWLPTQLVFKVDEKPIYRVSRRMVEQYGDWAFDNPKFLILNVALGGTYPAKENKVKSPYYGIPESTVERIKNDKAQMFVDWVRISKPVSASEATGNPIDGSPAQ